VYWLPLHYACIKRSSLTIIQLLVQAWPDAISEQDHSGYLPLHYACERCCTDDVIQFLIECWPISLRVKTKMALCRCMWELNCHWKQWNFWYKLDLMLYVNKMTKVDYPCILLACMVIWKKSFHFWWNAGPCHCASRQ